MCGIVGLINCGNEQVLRRMTGVISHRGPDDEGIVWFKENNSGLGHRRLSIIDLTPAGHQPMSILNEKSWITFNGEIYNYLEIKEELFSKGYSFKTLTDTEVILYAYKEWGIDCLQKFNGMFAFAIWDNEKKELFVARDRQGIKPFYYSIINKGLIFASEIKALLSSGLIEKQPDYNSIITPTRFQISPFTGFKDIFKLPPAHYFFFKDGKISLQKYWGVEAKEQNINSSSAIESMDYLLNEAVKLQMIADVPVGIFLSGGLDSSIIAALMRKNSNKDIHSFTIKFSDKDQKFEKMVDDSYYAKIVAEKFGFIHHEFEIDFKIIDLLSKLVYHLDEPLTDPAAINTYIMSQTARDNGIIVILNGMGGDEIFGGYRKYLACLFADAYQKCLPKIARNILEDFMIQIPVSSSTQGYRLLRWIKRFLSFASLPQYERFLSSDLSLSKDAFEFIFGSKVKYNKTYFYENQKKYFTNSNLSYLTMMCLNDTNVFLPEHNLTYSDKASMAASIESRPPLTDHRIIEFMFSLPPSFRINKRQQKFLLKKVSEKYLPLKIIHRPKAPFGSPLRSWIRGPLKPMIDEYLSEYEIKKRNLWNYNYIKKLIENDRKGIEDNAFYIFQFLTLQIWFKTFFD
jgi:asparagine synthase (glutamine-hydrolysing)